MKQIYFLDFVDSIVFKGVGKFVETPQAREEVIQIFKTQFKYLSPHYKNSPRQILGV